MRTARQAFLVHPAKEKFKVLAETTDFDTAREYALLTYVEELAEGMDPNQHWTNQAKILGAREVLAVLASLHVPIQPQVTERLPRLKPPS